jgi:hypothetical protein
MATAPALLTADFIGHSLAQTMVGASVFGAGAPALTIY